MPEFPLRSGGNDYDTVGHITADSGGTAVTPHATANTKTSSWVVISASTTIEANLALVRLRPGQLAEYLVDIAVGAAGSEKILFENLHAITRLSPVYYLFPVRIPVGSNISAKSQCQQASAVAIDVSITLIKASFQTTQELGGVTTYGATTADSGGKGVDPGGSLNTEGGWNQIVASTTNPIRQMIIAVGSRANGAMTTADWHLDIGVGASTAEKSIIPNLHLSAHTTSDELQPQVMGPFPVHIPAGTRISGQAQCSITDATDRLIDVIIYGVD